MSEKRRLKVEAPVHASQKDNWRLRSGLVRLGFLLGALAGVLEASVLLLRGSVRTATVVSTHLDLTMSDGVILLCGAAGIYGLIGASLGVGVVALRLTVAGRKIGCPAITVVRFVLGFIVFFQFAVWWNLRVMTGAGVLAARSLIGTTFWFAISVVVAYLVGPGVLRILRPIRRSTRWGIGAMALLGVLAVLFFTAGQGPVEIASTSGREQRVASSGSSLVIVTLDTTRADHLGPYSVRRVQTPTLDELAARGVVLRNVAAQAPITAPSHASLFTSKYPRSHGVLTNGQLLHSSHTTLAEVLAGHGYATAAFISGMPLKGEVSGLDQGFEVYDQTFTRFDRFVGLTAVMIANRLSNEALLERRADATTDRALDWAREAAPQRPFFLWVHYFDPHYPYVPPQAFQRAETEGGDPLARQIELYDSEISFMDAELGRLIEGLDATALLDDTLVVITADHGESLGEHSYFYDHGLYLYEPTVRVPLILAFPGVIEPGRVVEELVETVDVMPTVLDLLDMKKDAQFQGDVMPLPLVGRTLEAPPVEAIAFSQTLQVHGNSSTALFAVWQGRWKYVVMPATGQEELYDLWDDPGETTNLVTAERERAETLAGLLEDWLERTEPFEAETLDDPQILEQLKALGYLD